MTSTGYTPIGWALLPTRSLREHSVPHSTASTLVSGPRDLPRRLSLVDDDDGWDAHEAKLEADVFTPAAVKDELAALRAECAGLRDEVQRAVDAGCTATIAGS